MDYFKPEPFGENRIWPRIKGLAIGIAAISATTGITSDVPYEVAHRTMGWSEEKVEDTLKEHYLDIMQPPVGDAFYSSTSFVRKPVHWLFNLSEE